MFLTTHSKATLRCECVQKYFIITIPFLIFVFISWVSVLNIQNKTVKQYSRHPVICCGVECLPLPPVLGCIPLVPGHKLHLVPCSTYSHYRTLTWYEALLSAVECLFLLLQFEHTEEAEFLVEDERLDGHGLLPFGPVRLAGPLRLPVTFQFCQALLVLDLLCSASFSPVWGKCAVVSDDWDDQTYCKYIILS